MVRAVLRASPSRSSYIHSTATVASGCVSRPLRSCHENTNDSVVCPRPDSAWSATGRPTQSVSLLSRYRCRLGSYLSPVPHLSPRRPSSAGRLNLPGAPHAIAHHLDQRRTASGLARRILSLLAFAMESGPTVHSHRAARTPLVSRPLHRHRYRRHALAQNRPTNSTGLLPARSALAQVLCQSHVRPSLPASFPAGAAVSPGQGRLPRPAHRFRGSLGGQAASPQTSQTQSWQGRSSPGKAYRASLCAGTGMEAVSGCSKTPQSLDPLRGSHAALALHLRRLWRRQKDSAAGGGWQFLQPHRLRCRGAGRGVDRPRAQGHQTLFPRRRWVAPFLRGRKVYSRAGAARPDQALEGHQSLLRRKTPEGGIQRSQRGPLARGRTQAAAPFAGDPTHSLSQTEEWPLVLSPARFPAHYSRHRDGAPTPADLLRSLADRSQPSGREGHPGGWSSSVMERYIGSQTTRFCRGQLQCLTASLLTGLWRRTRQGLRSASQMAAPRCQALRAGPGHSTAQRNDGKPEHACPSWPKSHRPSLHRRCRCLKMYKLQCKLMSLPISLIQLCATTFTSCPTAI